MSIYDTSAPSPTSVTHQIMTLWVSIPRKDDWVDEPVLCFCLVLPHFSIYTARARQNTHKLRFQGFYH